MLKTFGLGLIFAAIAAAGSVETVRFDDIATPQAWQDQTNAWGHLGLNYAGFDWYDWEVMNGDAFAALYADPNPIPSSPNFAYPGFAVGAPWVISNAPFRFQGVQLSGWPDISPAALWIAINGYLYEELVGSVVVNLTYTGWTTAGGIDSPVTGLQFETAGNYFRMDNLELEILTPEPATLGLCGLALAGLAAFRKIRGKSRGVRLAAGAQRRASQ